MESLPPTESAPGSSSAIHAPTYSLLTEGHLHNSIQVASISGQERSKAPTVKLEIPDGWILARSSQVRLKPWNRQSILVLADFNTFEGLLGRDAEKRPYDEEEFGEVEDLDEAPSSQSRHGQRHSSKGVILGSHKASIETPYHVFSAAKKKQLVYIVSLAGLFSPLSSNIYFPALSQIATVLSVNISLVSLTITVYMVVQGLAPSFWGPLSDTQGRRTFIVYLISDVGLAFSKSFTGLMIFRGIQAAGSAATISIGAGVIGDITTARERGSLIGIFGGIRMMGQSIGPVFGGIITQFLGFHAIFWFLFGLGTLTLLLILLLLPETLRTIAGNGTLRLHGIHRPFIYSFTQSDDGLIDNAPVAKKKVTISSITSPLKFLFEKDVFITLFFGSIVYTVWSMVTSSTTDLFKSHFHLSNLQLGLVFLPNGAGCVTGSYLTGYLMDHDYRVIERQYREAKKIPDDIKPNRKELVDFPIEKSRLRSSWWIVLLFVITTASYGFSLNLNLIVVPLVLQFFIAYTATAVFSLNSALIIDLYPGASASATAVNNLMRCSVGAVGVAVVQLVIDKLGTGTTFLIFAIITASSSPLLAVEWFYGEGWRTERRNRLKAKEENRRQKQ
ncbi:hypothetical protein B7463_g3431, partial [Scytalidium lignicola]